LEAGIEPTQYFDAALKMDGSVWVWGSCAGGISGDGTMGGEIDKPTRVPIALPSGVTIKHISGGNAMLALASDGSVWAWWPAEDNVLGTGNTAANSGFTPAKVQGLPSDIVAISAGGSDFLLRAHDGGRAVGLGLSAVLPRARAGHRGASHADRLAQHARTSDVREDLIVIDGDELFFLRGFPITVSGGTKTGRPAASDALRAIYASVR